MNVCVIPARGGSKRIPRKNIRCFNGQPIISWSIKAALMSECIDRVIVSTDDHEIADLALSLGADVPFIRPAHLADDFATSQAVMAHAVEYLSPNSSSLKSLCCLYATAPFVLASDLCAGYQLLIESNLEKFIFTATSFSFPIQRAIKIAPNGEVSPFDGTSISKRSQDLDKYYHDAGQFYWASPQRWVDGSTLFKDSRALILPRHRVQDIDTEEDWAYAEKLFLLTNV